MTTLYSGIIILSLICRADTTMTPRWPIVGWSNKKIVSNLGDYRNGHIHLGIDITASTASVRSYSKTFHYLYRYHSATYKWFVHVEHVSDDSSCGKESGSKYIHMDTVNVDLDEDRLYTDINLAIDTEFYNNHLHFNFHTPSSDTGMWEKAINPMAQDSLKPDDSRWPTLDKMYVDDTLKGSATTNCLNFLGYSFDSLYSDTTSAGPNPITFKKLKLNATSAIDLDDPHIIISDSCKVKFIVRCYDDFSANDDRGAPYNLGLYLDTNVVECINDHFRLTFEYIDWGDKNKQEYIYHLEPPCSTIFATAAQFHRLYPFGANPPSCIVSKDTLKTEDLDEGMHIIRIIAGDFHSVSINADVYFYIRRSDWIDACRGFKE